MSTLKVRMLVRFTSDQYNVHYDSSHRFLGNRGGACIHRLLQKQF